MHYSTGQSYCALMSLRLSCDQFTHLKSGIPLAVLIPAPATTTMFFSRPSLMRRPMVPRPLLGTGGGTEGEASGLVPTSAGLPVPVLEGLPRLKQNARYHYIITINALLCTWCQRTALTKVLLTKMMLNNRQQLNV